jgi:hypothetical protein
MRALFDLAHCPDPQCLKSLVIELPAVVVPHGTILPDHKIKVGLLPNSLVRIAISIQVPLLALTPGRRRIRLRSHVPGSCSPNPGGPDKDLLANDHLVMT